MSKTDSAPALLDSQVWGVLFKAHMDLHADVSPAYDEVLLEVSERIRSSGNIGKADIGALLFWKRLRADTRWVRDLMVMADSEVRCVTSGAVAAVNETSLDVPAAAAQGRSALIRTAGVRPWRCSRVGAAHRCRSGAHGSVRPTGPSRAGEARPLPFSEARAIRAVHEDD